MRRRDFLRLTAASGAALCLSACGGASTQKTEGGAVQYFRYADNQSEDYPTTQAGYYFADLVRERTGGRIDIRVYADAELGDEGSVIEQVQLGMIDFARISTGAMSRFDPELNVLQMPYLYTDSAQMWRVLDGDIGARFIENLAAYDVYGLSWFDAGARSFYTREGPITTLAQMQGLVLRVQESSLMADVVRALGAEPLELVFKDVYPALQSGSIDGAENNFPSYESMSHDEVAKYFLLDEHLRAPELQIVSKTIMDSLSDEDQSVLRAAAAESALYERALWTQREAESRRAVEAAGTQINVLSAEELEKFRAAAAPLYEQYCADYRAIVEEIRNS